MPEARNDPTSSKPRFSGQFRTQALLGSAMSGGVQSYLATAHLMTNMQKSKVEADTVCESADSKSVPIMRCIFTSSINVRVCQIARFRFCHGYTPFSRWQIFGYTPMARHGGAQHGRAWPGMARLTQHGQGWPSIARASQAWPGLAYEIPGHLKNPGRLAYIAARNE